MTHMRFLSCVVLVVVVLAGMAGCTTFQTSSDVVSAVYRPDQAFPEFMPMWREGWKWTDENGDKVRYAYEGMPLGGYLFAYFRNASSEPLKVEDVLLDDVSLVQGIAWERAAKTPGMDKVVAHLAFSKLPQEQIDRLNAAGEPVWWKVEPTVIPPGGMGELTIRLRRDPKRDLLPVSIPAGDGTMLKTVVKVARRQPRFFSISFSPGLDEVSAYLRHPSGRGVAPARILVDGRDVTDRCTIAADDAIDTVAVTIDLETPFPESSYHFFQADYPDGSIAA